MKKFILFLFEKLYNKYSDLLNPLILKFYKKIVRSDFNIVTDIVKVKKGKAKFYVAFFKTKEGNIRVNLGRHRLSTEYNF